jgi:hypothetical protein
VSRVGGGGGEVLASSEERGIGMGGEEVDEMSSSREVVAWVYICCLNSRVREKMFGGPFSKGY